MPKLIPKRTIKLIKELRSKGWSLPEIYRQTQVGYGSVFRHIQGVIILPQYKQSWRGKWGGSRKRKELLQLQAQEKANKEIRDLKDKDILTIFACLYWAEGNKKDFSFTNTDPGMIKTFLKSLEILGVPKKDLRITIRTYEDLNKDFCINYWAKIAGIPEKQIVNVNVIKGKKKGKLPFGMCRVRIIKGGNMLKYAVALRNRIGELISPYSSTDRTGVS